MKKVLPVLFFICSIIASCEKVIDCDDAQVSIENIGSDTIYYCWGCNVLEDTLFPGEKAIQNVGPVYISEYEKTTIWTVFESTKGDYLIRVDDCLVERVVK